MGKEFIMYTHGLQTFKDGRNALVKVEVNRLEDNRIELQPVSGWNLAKLGGATVVNQSEIDAAPQDAYVTTVFSAWALQRCGYTVAGLTKGE